MIVWRMTQNYDVSRKAEHIFFFKNISHFQHISLHESKGGRHSVQTESRVLDSSKSLHEKETLGGLKVASH